MQFYSNKQSFCVLIPSICYNRAVGGASTAKRFQLPLSNAKIDASVWHYNRSTGQSHTRIPAAFVHPLQAATPLAQD